MKQKSAPEVVARLITRIRTARDNAEKEIGELSKKRSTGINYAGGLLEGYAGGYHDALNDVLLVLRTGLLPDRRGWWNER